MGEVEPKLGVALWNGLFVHKDVPQAARDKIIAIAKKTKLSDRAQKLAKETGAGVYWTDADDAAAQIVSDQAAMARLGELLQ